MPIQTINEINKEHFSIIERSSIWKAATGVTPENIADIGARIVTDSILTVGHNTNHVPLFVNEINELIDNITSFWKQRDNEISDVLRSTPGTSVLVVTDGPHDFLTDVKRHFPFFDTVLFSDPIASFCNIKKNAGKYNENTKLSIGVVYVILQLKIYRDLFLRGDNPLAAFVPSEILINETYENEANQFSSDTANKILSKASDTEIKTPVDLVKILEKNGWGGFYRTPLLSTLFGIPQENLSEFVKSRVSHHKLLGTKWPLPDITLLRAHIASHVRLLCWFNSDAYRFGQDPAVPTSLFGLSNWLAKLENKPSATLNSGTVTENELFSIGVQADSLNWLSSLPLEDIWKVREMHSIETIRREFTLSRLNIKKADITDVNAVSKKIAYEINSTIKRHTQSVNSLRSTLGVNKVKVSATFATATTISIVGAIFPPLSLPATAISILFGGSAVVDLIKNIKDNKKQIKSMELRPLSIFSNLKNKEQVKL